VYERTGGHAYGSVYPGPIGAVLSPQLTGVGANASLPFASSLCGACLDACPVAIDIPSMLVHLRARAVDEAGGRVERAFMDAAAWTMRDPRRWQRALRLVCFGRIAGRRRGRIVRAPVPFSAWTRTRDLPRPPRQSFRDWWRREGSR
jgi:L-lactate dehydrogenase complex protein LldF